jgi:hypothetical protein
MLSFAGSSGDLLPPSPPAEKANAELMLYLERAASALDVLSISGVPALPVSTDMKILYGFHQNNAVVIQKIAIACSFNNQLKIICSAPEAELDPTSHRSPMGA